jgi:hypothetical protein
MGESNTMSICKEIKKLEEQPKCRFRRLSDPQSNVVAA